MLKSNLEQKEDKRAADLQLYLESPKQSKLIDLAQLISPNNQFSEDQRALGVKITKDKLTAQYNTTFSRAEIHKEAHRYNLAFIQGRNYAGEFSMEFLQRLSDFLEEKKIAASEDDLRTQIYVLAPAWSDPDGPDMRPVKDPLMFYRVEEGNYFVLIDGSKNYVSLFNYWLGIKNYSETLCRTAISIENTLIAVIIFYSFSYIYDWHATSIWWIIMLMIVGFLTHFIRMGLRSSHHDGIDHYDSSFNKNKYKL